MQTQRFDALRERLIADGVSPRYAQRLVSELAQHWEELNEAARRSGMSPDDAARHAHEQLGTDEDITKRVHSCGQFIAFGRRHPVICFLIAPPLAVAAIIAAGIMMFAVVIGALRSHITIHVEGWLATLVRFAGSGSVPLVCAVLTAWFFFYARSRCCPLRWPLLACLMLTAAAGVIMIDIVPPSADRGGMVTAGAWLPWAAQWPMLAPAATFLLLRLTANWPASNGEHADQSGRGATPT